MTTFRKKDGALTPMGSKILRVKTGAAIQPDEAISRGQLESANSQGQALTIAGVIAFTGANTHTGIETHTGAETHSGAEVFSNAAGVTTDTITPRTSGAGTSVQDPVTPWLLNLAPAITASGSVFLANATTTTVANTITLPACTAGGVGTTYKVKVIKAVTAGGTYVVNTTGSDVFLGGVYGTIAAPNATNDAFFGASTANKTLTLNATTTGGLIGGWLEFTMISATQWSVSGVTLGTGTQATPFSN